MQGGTDDFAPGCATGCTNAATFAADGRRDGAGCSRVNYGRGDVRRGELLSPADGLPLVDRPRTRPPSSPAESLAVNPPRVLLAPRVPVLRWVGKWWQRRGCRRPSPTTVSRCARHG